MPVTFILSLLLIVPILEIAIFILIGSQIGVFTTLAMILVTAMLGTILLRQQGFGILQRLQAENRAGHQVGRDMIHGAMIMIAGILLLTPGFVTDCIGFLLFVPSVRDLLWAFLKSHIHFVGQGHRTGASRRDDFARGPHGGEKQPFVDLNADEYNSEPNPDTPWRDHHNNGYNKPK